MNRWISASLASLQILHGADIATHCDSSIRGRHSAFRLGSRNGFLTCWLIRLHVGRRIEVRAATTSASTSWHGTGEGASKYIFTFHIAFKSQSIIEISINPNVSQAPYHNNVSSTSFCGISPKRQPSYVRRLCKQPSIVPFHEEPS